MCLWWPRFSDSHPPGILFLEINSILVAVLPDCLAPAIAFSHGNSGSTLSESQSGKSLLVFKAVVLLALNVQYCAFQPYRMCRYTPDTEASMAERKGGQGLGYHSVSQSGVADNKLLPKVRQDGPLRLKDRQRSTKKLKAGWYCVAMFEAESPAHVVEKADFWSLTDSSVLFSSVA